MSENKNMPKIITISLLLLGVIITGILLNNEKSVNPQIVEAVQGDSLFTTKDTPFEAKFGNKEDPTKIIFQKDGSILRFKLPYKEIDWRKEEDKIIADVGDKAFSYTLLKEGNKATGIKEEIILKKPTDENQFEFSLELENLKYKKLADGLWHFYDLEDNELFYIPKPYMIDASGNRSENVQVRINDKENKLVVTADKNWLLSPDRKYPITIDPTLKLTVLTVRSHPQEGDNWEVDFETEGQADLYITPDDQATIDDIDFVSLTCDGNNMEPQILENDVIYAPQWECSGIGNVNHLVNVAAPHRLKFEFGDQVAYAYNAPGSSTYTFSGVTQSTNDYFAYEKYGASSFSGPDDTGNSEATNTDYSNITSNNATRWTTDSASTEGNYDAQLYKFYIDETESDVTQLDFKWNGYGTGATGYNTTFYAYDYDSTSWTQLSQVDFSSLTDQDLTHTESTSPGKFIDTDGEVVLMAQTTYTYIPQYARPDSDAGTTITWTGSDSGTTNLYSYIDETTASDTDYIESQGNSTGYIELGLSNTTDPGTHPGHTIKWRAQRTATNKSLTVVMRLYQGGTQIASQSQSDASLDSFTTFTYNLTTGEASNITDYTDLRIRFDVTVNGGGSNTIQVSWAELQVPE